MGAQSAVMMKMAGENWQYGKRRISAMSNEDFNAMSPVKLYQIETEELRAIIPSIESSLASMTPLTSTIVTEMLNTFKVGAQATGAYLTNLLDTPMGNIIKSAIVIWMPWLIPLLDVIPDIQGETKLPPPIIDDFPEIKPPKKEKKKKTNQEIKDEEKELIEHLEKVHEGNMKEYTIFLAKLSKLNQQIKVFTQQLSILIKNKMKKSSQYKNIKQKLNTAVNSQAMVKKNFMVWKKNNAKWLSHNNLS